MLHRLARPLVALAGAAVAALALSGTAQADPVSPGTKKVLHQLTGHALSVVGHNPGVAPGQWLTLAPYAGHTSQRWSFIDKPDGRHQLRNGANASLCASPNGSGSLQLQACSGAAWLFVGTEAGGGRSIRPHAGGPPAGSFGEHQNVFFDALEVGTPDPWHQWSLVSLTTTPPAEGDPFPPVCNVKPSLPQCNP